MIAALEGRIARGLAQLELAPAAAAPLARFIEQLARWNRVYNLTAVRDREAMVTRHVFDSLVIGPWLRGPRVLDVGSGAGLPGIPLAIVHPALHFYLLDSSGKRTRFMTQTVAELTLANVSVIRARVEHYQPDRPFTTVMARALAPPPQLLALTGRLCATDGRVLAMQGGSADPATTPPGWRLIASHRLQVPDLAAARQLLHFEPLAAI